jgi:hypothetical protein
VKPSTPAPVACSAASCLKGDGYFYPVTLLVDVTPDMTAACEETFGPVAVVMKAASADDALAMANDSRYGLAAAVWTDAKRGEEMAAKLETGQVAVNGIVKTDPRLPSGASSVPALAGSLGRTGFTSSSMRSRSGSGRRGGERVVLVGRTPPTSTTRSEGLGGLEGTGGAGRQGVSDGVRSWRSFMQWWRFGADTILFAGADCNLTSTWRD